MMGKLKDFYLSGCKVSPADDISGALCCQDQDKHQNYQLGKPNPSPIVYDLGED